MGVVHDRRLLAVRPIRPALALLVTIAILGCAPERDSDRPPSRAAAPGRQAEPDTVPPPVENGRPMPPAENAAGIPPYPSATVWIRDRTPKNVHRLEAFTLDTWDQVIAFYEDSLPTWRIRRAKDLVLFEKEPDQASVIIIPWNAAELPEGAPRALVEARTAIGVAWR